MAIRHDRNLVGPQVRELRRKRRWPQRLVAQKLCGLGFNATRSRVAKVEDGELIVNDFHLTFLSKVLAVDSAELFQPFSRYAAAWKKKSSRSI
jgi:hypothetical protein